MEEKKQEKVNVLICLLRKYAVEPKNVEWHSLEAMHETTNHSFSVKMNSLLLERKIFSLFLCKNKSFKMNRNIHFKDKSKTCSYLKR